MPSPSGTKRTVLSVAHCVAKLVIVWSPRAYDDCFVCVSWSPLARLWTFSCLWKFSIFATTKLQERPCEPWIATTDGANEAHRR